MIKNSHDAPASFVSFCSNDEYSKGNSQYSATARIAEPRIVEFTKRYPELIIDDPYENPWKFISTIFHQLMADHSPLEETAEERLYTDIDGVRISGAMDVQTGSENAVTIGDYKMTTVFGIKDTRKFEEQLNIYAYLVEKETSKRVENLKIYAFLRDWKISMAEKMKTYPKRPGVTIDINLWSYEEREYFIREKIALHEQSKDLDDDDLIPCTHEGRWPTGSLYSVTRLDNDTTEYFRLKGDSEKYISSLSEEEQFSAFLDKTFEDYRRCKSYCFFNNICNVYKEFKNGRK